jgi:MYXO-CTERM domain-containing protein
MNRVVSVALAAACVVCASGAALAVEPNGVVVTPRIFNDYPNSTLNIVNDFPNLVSFDETNFGAGGFANRHSAYFSTDGGATARDFGYNDAFDLAVSVSNTSDPITGREAGFHADLFGFGFFGALPNGEIAAFGSILPFHSFGGGLWTPGQEITLRVIHRPGEGDGVNPLPMGAAPSTIEYIYDLGSGPVSSGLKAFTGTEGGIPENFSFLFGVGTQNAGAPGGTAHVEFRNFVVPAPGAAGLLALGGLVALRRRRA